MSFESIALPSAGLFLSPGAGMLDDVMPCRVSPVLVGRDEELAVLQRAHAAVQTGSAAAVLIGGEVGVGKSRLIGEFADRAGSQVLMGGCLELGTAGLPFAPFTQVLRQLVRERGAAGVRELLPDRAGRELGRLLPELGEPAEPDGEAFQGEARARLFEQLLALLGRLAQDGPVTLIIEDAHWADRSTRDLLTFLIGNQHALPGLLILVTFRSDELHRSHPLRPLLAELGRMSSVERMELPRLSRPDAMELIAAIVDGEPNPAMADVVFRRSDGNPLFVEHLVDCDAEVPDSLRDLVLASMLRLPEETRDLLRVASAAGIRVGHDLLASVTGLGDDELSRTLRPAVAANVLLADGDGYQFRHALIQEVMHEDLLPGEHSRLHARYAEAISARPALVPAGRAGISLAHHWYSAHDITWALVSAWQAAAESGHVLAYSEQLTLLSRVLELWDNVPDAAERIGADHVHVLAAAVDAAHLAGESERGVAFATAALQEIDTAAEPDRAAIILERRAALCAQGELAAEADDLSAALALVSDGKHEAARAAVLASLSHAQHKRHADAQARASAEEALELAGSLGLLGPQATALLTLAMLDLESGRGSVAAVLDLLAQARAAAAQTQDYPLVLRAAINESHALEGAGRHVRAAAVAREGRADAERYGLSRTSGAILAVNEAEPLVAAGQWSEATETLRSALAAPSVGPHRSSLWRVAGDLAQLRGDLEAARNAVAAGRAALSGLSYRAQSHLPHYRLEIDFAAADGDLASALARARQVVRTADLQSSPRYAWPVLVTSARVAAGALLRPAAVQAGDDAEDARTLLEELQSQASKLEAAGPLQEAHRLTLAAEQSRVARSEQPGSESSQPALVLWQDAAAAWDELDQPWETGYALYRVAEAALAGQADREAAARPLTRAARIAGDLGAEPLAGEIAVLARRARIPLTGSGTAGSPSAGTGNHGLTPREFEVLRLMATGRSNAAIAADLFISAKTVSVHVSNILGKLGAANRAEAAAIAHRLRLVDETGPASTG